MELFLPGLVSLLIIALIVFLVLPRLGAPVLASLALILLVYGIWSHMTLFYAEYRYTTWTDRIKTYGPMLLIGMLILASLSYIMYLFGTQGPSALPASNLTPSQTLAVNNAVNSVANTLGLNTGKKNNGTILENLGGILNTPNKPGLFNRR